MLSISPASRTEGPASPATMAFLAALAALPLVFAALWWPDFWQIGSTGNNRRFVVAAFEILVCVLAALSLGLASGAFRPLPRLAWAGIAAVFAIAIYHGYHSPWANGVIMVRAANWAIHLAFGLSVYALAVSGRLNLDAGRLAIAFMATSLLYMTVFLVSVILQGQPGEICADLMPGFGNVRFTGYMMAPALALLAWMLVSPGQRNLPAPIIAAAMALIWFYVVWTGSRGTIFGVFAALPVLALSAGVRKALAIFAVAAGTLLAAIAASFVVPASQCMAFGLFRMFEGSQGNFTSGRMKIWKASIELISERPWFGYGEIPIRELIGGKPYQLHNSVLQVAFSWGIIGSLVFWSLVAWLLLPHVFGRKGNQATAPVLFALLSLLAYSLIDGTLYHVYPVMLTVLLAAVLAALSAQHQNG